MSAWVKGAERNLRFLLQPIQHLLDEQDITDLRIIGVGEGKAFIDRGDGFEQITLPFTLEELELIAINAAALTQQDIAEDVPIVSTRFPDGERVEIQCPPAVAAGTIALAIRKPKQRTPLPEELEYADPRWLDGIFNAVVKRRNIVFTGSSGSGKTHVLRAFTNAIARDALLVTIEDAPELINLPVPNVTNLFYSKGGQSVAKTNAEDLVASALRMRPDGILMQELRDEAAYAYLSALESGHWGMTTTHTDGPDQVKTRITRLVRGHQTGRHLDKADVMDSLERSIHMVVHCVRDGRRRYISEVIS